MNASGFRQVQCSNLSVAEQGILFDAESALNDQAIAYTTSLLALKSGTILAGWQSGPGKHTPNNTIRLSRSVDGGRTWNMLPYQFDTRYRNVPGSFLCAPMVEVERGKILLFTTWFDRSEPERPLFDPETEGLLRSRQLFCSSTDEGESWSPWEEMPTPGLTGCAVSGPVARWADGTIAVSFESFKEFDDPSPLEPAAWLCISRDRGKSFSKPWLMAQHPEHKVYYWDQRIWPTHDNDGVLAMYWTHDRSEKRDLNVHLIHKSLTDDPRSNSLPIATSLKGQIAAPYITKEGLLFAVVVDRGCPGTITLYQSADLGRTWPTDARLILHTHDETACLSQGRDNIDFAQYWEDMAKWSFGHPAICPLPDGWLTAWYAGTPEKMSVHWARVSESA